MPAPKPNDLAAGRPSKPVFASVASDPPIARTSRRMRVAALAMAVAALIWMLVAIESLGPGAPIDLLIMAMAGSLLDGFVALQLWQQQWSRTVLVYVIVRTVLAAGGFVLLCLPPYLIALIAVPTSESSANPPDPDVAHPFRQRPGGWFYEIALPWLMRRRWGRDETGRRMCVCGKPQRDEVHDPVA